MAENRKRETEMIKKLNTFWKNERTGHSVFYVIFLIVCFLAVGAGFVCFRLRNGVQVMAGGQAWRVEVYDGFFRLSGELYCLCALHGKQHGGDARSPE